MALQKVQSLLFPMGTEPTFWKTMQNIFKENGGRGSGYELDFDEWESLIKYANDCGLLAVYMDDKGEPQSFVGPFGDLVLQRMIWLRDSKAKGLTAFEAEGIWNKEIYARRKHDEEVMARNIEQRVIERERQANASGRRRGKEVDL